MQEDQTVTFQPMYDAYPPAWYTKLFLLYLLVVLALLLIRAMQIGSGLRKLRKLQKSPGDISITSEALCSRCFLKVHSLKSFAKLTLLASVLNLALNLSDIFDSLRTAKRVNPGSILPYVGDSLIPFSWGLIVCSALYISAMIAEYSLRRRQDAIVVGTAPVHGSD